MKRKRTSERAKSRILLAVPIIALLLLCLGCLSNSHDAKESTEFAASGQDSILIKVDMDDGETFTVSRRLDELELGATDTLLVQMDGDTTMRKVAMTVTKIDNDEDVNVEMSFTKIDNDDEVFVIVDAVPQYPGGDEARLNFLRENIRYPEEARKNGIQGTVYVTFIVEKDGTVSNVKIARGLNKLCDEECIRVTQLMPKWIPGKQRGKIVRVSYNMPIKFTIPASDGEK